MDFRHHHQFRVMKYIKLLLCSVHTILNFVSLYRYFRFSVIVTANLITAVMNFSGMARLNRHIKEISRFTIGVSHLLWWSSLENETLTWNTILSGRSRPISISVWVYIYVVQRRTRTGYRKQRWLAYDEALSNPYFNA